MCRLRWDIYVIDFGFTKYNHFSFQSVIFFHLWRLWLNHGNHLASRNPRKKNVRNLFLNHQWFMGIKIPCHFVVLLINHFKDWYLELVSLHLTKSNCCELCFSKIKVMIGTSCAYEFLELMSCSSLTTLLSLNMVRIYGLQFGQVHNKIEKMWVDLHLLQEGESIANLIYNI